MRKNLGVYSFFILVLAVASLWGQTSVKTRLPFGISCTKCQFDSKEDCDSLLSHIKSMPSSGFKECGPLGVYYGSQSEDPCAWGAVRLGNEIQACAIKSCNVVAELETAPVRFKGESSDYFDFHKSDSGVCLPSLSVLESLQLEPSIHVVRMGGLGGQTSLFIRGTKADHLAVLLEGRRLNGGFSGSYRIQDWGTSRFFSTTVEAGPSFGEYGIQPIGGSVHLKKMSHPGRTVMIDSEAGSFGYLHSGCSFEKTISAYSVQLSADFTQAKNAQPNSQYRQMQLLPHFDYKLSDTCMFNLLGALNFSDKQNAGSTLENTFPLEGNFDRNSYWLISPGVECSSDLWLFKSFGAFSRDDLRSRTTMPGGTQWNAYEIDMYQVALNAQREGELLGLEIDGGYIHYVANKRSLIGLEDPFKRAISEANVGVALEWFSLGPFSLKAGGRYNHYSLYQDAYSCFIGTEYELNHGRLFLKYMRAIASPSINDIAAHTSGGSLKPELGHSFEWGVLYLFHDNAYELSLKFFYNDLRQLIDFEFIGGTCIAFNRDRAQIYGVESKLSYQTNKAFQWSCAYTYMEAYDTSTVRVRLVRRPRHKGVAKVAWQVTQKWSMSLECIGIVDTVDIAQLNLQNYIYTQFKTQYQCSNQWALHTRLENLLNQRYEQVRGFPQPGFQMYVGISFQY